MAPALIAFALLFAVAITSVAGDKPEYCGLEPEVGMCRGLFRMYYYNSTVGKCEEFIYGGCGGNDNRFFQESECEAACHTEKQVSHPEYCGLEAEPGMCRGYFRMYYYNTHSGKCEEFIYGGCGGNDNRFGLESECEAACHAA